MNRKANTAEIDCLGRVDSARPLWHASDVRLGGVLERYRRVGARLAGDRVVFEGRARLG